MAQSGAKNIGLCFSAMRIIQGISLIAIIGMSANFVSEMVNADQAAPPVIVGTLSVTCIACIYVILSLILHFDAHLPNLICAGLDSAFVIALIVVTVTVGRPFSYLNCFALASSGSTLSFLESVKANMGKVNYFVWVGASKTTCLEVKSIWGLAIGLCVSFALSSVCCAIMWKIDMNEKKAKAEPKQVDV